MGTFMGHVIPGTFFIMFGIWWTVRTSIRYYTSKFTKGKEFRSTLTFPIKTQWGVWQVEGYAKIFFATVGIIGELVTGMSNFQMIHIGNGQHATMFFFYGFSGVVDLLLHHKVVLPKNSDYIMVLLAVFVEGLLFKFHLHGRDELNVQIHTLLVYTLFLACIVIVAEMSWPNNVLFPFGRAFLILLQGTWFYQVAFILYNPIPNAVPWDGDDHKQMMLTTIIFAWHIMVIFVFILAVALLTGCYYRRRMPTSYRDDLAMERLIAKEQNGHTLIPLESDEDLEYEAPGAKS